MNPGPVVCVAAHPDDETVGAAARLSRMARARDVCILHTTDGAPRDPRFRPSRPHLERDAYGRERRAELTHALAIAGIDARKAACLGAVDLEAITTASHSARELEHILRETHPEVVITHPYEGGHPDHDATALIVYAACTLLARSGRSAPRIVEMSSYHGAPGRLVTGELLAPNLAVIGEVPGTRRHHLHATERAMKRAMFDAFVSQRDVLAPFGCDVELARDAPSYAWDRAPHEGSLWYERLGMGSSDEWRARAKAALAKLDLIGPTTK